MTVTLLLLAMLTLTMLALLVAPYLGAPGDPVPVDAGAAAVLELEEERDALYRAIADLRDRSDLAVERRDALCTRYEAKAANVVHELHNLARDRRARRRARRPLRPALVLLLLLAVPSVALVSAYTLPRVGEAATVTTARSDEIALGGALKVARRRAQQNPNGDTLAALGDTYWRIIQTRLQATAPSGNAPSAPIGELGPAREAYTRALALGTTEPSQAHRRLGLLALVDVDLVGAAGHLEAAVATNPADTEALHSLAQTYQALSRYEDAAATWRRYLATPAGERDAEATEQARLATDLAPLADAVRAERSYGNLMALADALWERDERAPAAGLYIEVLTGLGVEDPRAIGRIGIELFLEGDARSAVIALERALALEPAPSPEQLLALGNAYRSVGEAERAIAAWEAYVAAVGGSDQAGPVPDLLSQVRTELEAGSSPPDASAAVAVSPVGAALFATNCAACHGAAGAGGSGPSLVSNRRARSEALVRDAIRYGRATMPGFGALLTPAEIDGLIRYVQALAGS